jgi:hypothetical protein
MLKTSTNMNRESRVPPANLDYASSGSNSQRSRRALGENFDDRTALRRLRGQVDVSAGVGARIEIDARSLSRDEIRRCERTRVWRPGSFG